MSKKKGSAILVVVILTITIAAYIGSAIISNNNCKIITSKYDKILEKYYSSQVADLDSQYEELLRINK